MPRKAPYSREEIAEAISKSNSISEAMRSMGLIPRGSNYEIFRKKVLSYGINTSHFDISERNRASALKGCRSKEQFIKDVLVKDGPGWTSHNLKHKLFKLDILKNECSECGLLPMWRGKKLVLHLDHINGDSRDNRMQNLRILCPNCHSQTETYCPGRKMGAVPHAGL
jgi:hypothetical protein